MPGYEDRKLLFYAVSTGLFIASYTVIDGIGVRYSGDSLSYIIWLFALEGWPFLLWGIFVLRRRFISFTCQNWTTVLGGAVFSQTAYGLVIAALAIGPMAYVSALRETSVILAALFGTFLLKESFGAWRISASILVGGGVIFMNYFG